MSEEKDEKPSAPNETAFFRRYPAVSGYYPEAYVDEYATDVWRRSEPDKRRNRTFCESFCWLFASANGGFSRLQLL